MLGGSPSHRFCMILLTHVAKMYHLEMSVNMMKNRNTHTHTNKFYTLLLVKKTGCTIQLYATVVGSGTYFVEENSIRAGRERK